MEELANTAGMSGFVSFFTNPLLQPTETSITREKPTDALDSTPVDTTMVDTTGIDSTGLGKELSSTAEKRLWDQEITPLAQTSLTARAVAKLPTSVESTPVKPTPVASLLNDSVSVTAPSGYLFEGIRGKRHVREARVAQDGHSLGEQVVYQALWNGGTPTTDPDFRLATIGWIRLGQAARMTDKNAKHNVKSLIKKLALEPVGYGLEGTSYRVFSYAAILRRRREAGLTHFIRHKGVTFVSASGHPIESTMVDSTVVDDHKSGKSTMVETVESTIVETVESTRVETATPYRKPSLGTSLRELSLSEITQFQQKAGPLIGLDDDAARAIIHSCREHDPDASVEEIWHFCEQKILERARQRESVGPGLLIVAIPKYFAPPASELRRYRSDRYGY